MLPKDLLDDLEAGDRTTEFLKVEETPPSNSIDPDLLQQLAAMQQNALANQQVRGQQPWTYNTAMTQITRRF